MAEEHSKIVKRPFGNDWVCATETGRKRDITALDLPFSGHKDQGELNENRIPWGKLAAPE